MKSTVEQLSPTRVRINVEVPFEELKPDFDKAYKALAQQVRLPGFRPGKAPAKLLEARVGRGAVLEQVVNDALPSRYCEAVTTAEVKVIGQPEIEITKIEDGEELAFTAEVDVRPEIALPDYATIEVAVDPLEISDEDIEEQLQSLRQRFGTLTGVERAGRGRRFRLHRPVGHRRRRERRRGHRERPVARGRFRPAHRGPRRGASIGLQAEESKEFTSTLVAGEHAGKEAVVTVNACSRSRSASFPRPTTSSLSWPASSTPSTS